MLTIRRHDTCHDSRNVCVSSSFIGPDTVQAFPTLRLGLICAPGIAAVLVNSNLWETWYGVSHDAMD